MIGVLLWMVRAVNRNFCPAPGYSNQPSIEYHFPHRTLFHFFSPHRPAIWAGRRAGSPVSVSLSLTLSHGKTEHDTHGCGLGYSDFDVF